MVWSDQQFVQRDGIKIRQVNKFVKHVQLAHIEIDKDSPQFLEHAQLDFTVLQIKLTSKQICVRLDTTVQQEAQVQLLVHKENTEIEVCLELLELIDGLDTIEINFKSHRLIHLDQHAQEDIIVVLEQSIQLLEELGNTIIN